MVDELNQIQLELESLWAEYKEIKEEIETICRGIEAKQEKGEDIKPLVNIQNEKFTRAYVLVSEFSRHIDQNTRRK